jgi:AcrR family transcriptional regulator
MGRPKEFTRETVLEKAIPVFWAKGYSETTVQDLESATGVNKSGLYSEFKDKEDIFLTSLQHYLKTRGGDDLLSALPLGWDNIQRFLKIGQTCYTGKKGCFSVNSMRDVAMLPQRGKEIIAESNEVHRRLIIKNIRAVSESPKAGDMADMVLTFFSGLCIEENLDPRDAATARRVKNFMNFLRQLA